MVTLFVKIPDNPEGMGGKNNIPLFLEPDDVTISSTDSFSNFSINGSSAYNDYKKLNSYLRPGVCYASPGPEFYYNYIKSNPDAPATPYAIYRYAIAYPAKNRINSVKSFYNNLSADNKNYYFGLVVQKLIHKK